MGDCVSGLPLASSGVSSAGLGGRAEHVAQTSGHMESSPSLPPGSSGGFNPLTSLRGESCWFLGKLWRVQLGAARARGQRHNLNKVKVDLGVGLIELVYSQEAGRDTAQPDLG